MQIKPRMWRRISIATLAGMLSAVVAVPQTPVSAQSSRPALQRLDVSQNNLINDVDALSLAENWKASRQQGACILDPVKDSDLNGDGCIDVADIQMQLAAWGTVADPAAPAPQLGDARGPASTITVNARGDGSDDSSGSGECDTDPNTAGGQCTLRAAIETANARAGADTIQFNIRNDDGSCPTGVITIDSTRAFRIEDANTTIDGYTQCGAQENTAAATGNAKLKIELSGSNDDVTPGLWIFRQSVVIRGLSIYNWNRQIFATGDGARDGRYEGNFIGTNAAQTFSQLRGGEHTRQGLVFGNKASNNLIGGPTPAARNIIAGNGKDGVQIQDLGTNGNVVINNYIGVKQDGVTALQNKSDGIDINGGAQSNRIGGPSLSERNIISGNTSEGIEISHNTETKFNEVIGNYFGIGVDGKPIKSATYGNGGSGLSFEDEVSYNKVYNNIFVNSADVGVRWYILGAYNQVYDNKIGVGPNGEAMGNGKDPNTTRTRNGVYLLGGAHHNIIRNNQIANSPENGVYLSNTSDQEHNGFGETFFNTISQNSIFNNGDLGIRLGATNNVRANQGIPAPEILTAAENAVTGRAKLPTNAICVGCTIELFITDGGGDAAGEGKTYLASGATDAAGNFNISVCGLVDAGRKITATSTDPAGNTSQFAANVTVGAADCPPPILPKAWLPLVQK